MENSKMDQAVTGQTVLVTGGSGFIASYCMIALLKAGYSVRATLRSLRRVDEVKEMLRAGGVQDFGRLSFVEADLGAEAGWLEAVRGCTYVIHPASPTPKPGATGEGAS